MLPAKVSGKTAVFWIAIHAILTAAAGLALGLVPQLDWLYLLPMLPLSLILLQRTWRLYQQPEKQPAFALFHFSNLYLTAVIAVIMLGVIYK